MSTMEQIIEILIRRDGCTRNEALDRIKECQQRLEEEAVATGDYEAAQDIVAEELGLEPDYLIALLL